jgi:large subunit ribosomal protein L25
MAEKTVLTVAPRTVLGKATKRLRREGLVPANIYGHKKDSKSIQIDALAFDHIRRQHGLRNIISLELPGAEAENVLVRHIQRDPVTGKIIHVDFARVNIREHLEFRVSLNFVGEAPGVKLQGGVLLHLTETITVDSAASDIVESLDVDISVLTEIDSTLVAGDVNLPERYKLITDATEPIAKISAPRVETTDETTAVAEGTAGTTEGNSAGADRAAE